MRRIACDSNSRMTIRATRPLPQERDDFQRHASEYSPAKLDPSGKKTVYGLRRDFLAVTDSKFGQPAMGWPGLVLPWRNGSGYKRSGRASSTNSSFSPRVAGQIMPRRYFSSIVFSAAAWLACAGGSLHAQGPSLDVPDNPAAVIAMVGQSPILMGDMSPKVDAKIAEVLSKISQEVPKDQIEMARVNFTRQALAQAIQNKVMRESFLLDQVATQSADKRRDADEMMTTKARTLFFDSEIPELKKQYETEDLTELDRQLREKGSSLESRQRDFVDQMLGHLYIRSKVEKDPNVTIAEINEYYETHRSNYQHAARARWEQLSVIFAKVPSRDVANTAIWEMGREAYYGGNLQAVAREKSQEPFASKGGLHEWTEKGSLASAILDEQVFSLPVFEMSQIIEDSDGLHIIRVLEREEEGITSLVDVQDEIRAKLRQQKINASQTKVMEAMRDRVPVWSLFPEDIPGAKLLPRAVPSTATLQNNLPPKVR